MFHNILLGCPERFQNVSELSKLYWIFLKRTKILYNDLKALLEFFKSLYGLSETARIFWTNLEAFSIKNFVTDIFTMNYNSNYKSALFILIFCIVYISQVRCNKFIDILENFQTIDTKRQLFIQISIYNFQISFLGGNFNFLCR